MSRIHPFSFCVVAILASVPYAVSQDIQAEREHWALHARNGAAQLAEAAAQMEKLYAQSGDAKVRADLIALLLRQNKSAEALAVCPTCAVTDYAPDELENLGKAARNVRQPRLAYDLYSQLQIKMPAGKVGYLGAALAATDAAEYAAAKNQIEAYKQRFGDDADIRQAENYLNQFILPLSVQLVQQQKQLEANPESRDNVLALYRTAARMQLFPLQERLMERYPNYFNEQDKLWLEATEAAISLRASRSAGHSPKIQEAYQRLSAVVDKTVPGTGIHTQALRDRMAAAVAVGKNKQALEDYRILEKQGVQPPYVQKEYVQALLMSGSPNKAGPILDAERKRQESTKSGKINPELVELLVRKESDLMHFDKAEENVKLWNTSQYIPDFTHNVQIKNPYYETAYFWNARLKAWKGDAKGAQVLMDSWLDEHPADPWAMILQGEFKQSDGKEDEAVAYFDEAREYLPEREQQFIDAKSATAYMAAGNWSAVNDLAIGLSRDEVGLNDFWRAYDLERAAQLNISGSAMKATSPEDGTEWSETMQLYSPRSREGHRAYVLQQRIHVPNHGDQLASGRVGAGLEVNLHPFVVQAEAGRGTQLNDKGYGSLGVDYRVNDDLSLNARAAINSENTPVKALKQGVYADEYSIGARYNPSAKTTVGASAGIFKFDDGNTRKSAGIWLNHNIFQYNRWKLDGSLSADYGRNKNIPEAFYYNPEKNKSFDGLLALTYTIPMDNQIIFRQTLSGGAGRYSQTGRKTENTWQIKYGHGWSFGRRAVLGYEFGRRQAVYDGAPEYHNFGSLNLSLKLY
ncbi:poly-beta-1,6 N-acetyl-D-glucosamine export porin PgaA [Neisseria montereyensis]|uniref:Poly-beta-1,6 N-acetyl-D-glucosamine export porin PgaA n=1 Tax=Neisseria montereyensis TaxID=2973938 RepID=A0ABT2FBA9_9NEIS|nr:poly-beta-1,6 N-acetyl-D-glucosamine export porin PgaA [Neisseria montereyensis]MCS4532845.1 poly-beta-1,6 N-acetyl-D-glucosamine export porin PgaA [Neisseria montereyensis]